MSYSANAQSIVDSYETKDVAVTIYPENLALVNETRRVKLPKGAATIKLWGVSDHIISESAILSAFEGFEVTRTLDNDLISPHRLLEKSAGETVSLRRFNVATGKYETTRATLISAQAPTPATQGTTQEWVQTGANHYERQLVGGRPASTLSAVFKINGEIETLNCTGLMETLLLSNLPEGLNPVPMLSLEVESETATKAELELTYLTRGMSWAADYRIDDKDRTPKVDMTGWLTLENKTSMHFKEVEINVIAGTVNQKRQHSNYVPPVNTLSTTACWPKGELPKSSFGNPNYKGGNTRGQFTVFNGVSDEVVTASSTRVTQTGEILASAVVPISSTTSAIDPRMTVSTLNAQIKDFGDYKFFTLPRKITLPPLQSKQIAFLNETKINTAWKGSLTFNPTDQTSQTTLVQQKYSIFNTGEDGLNRDIPAGRVNVFKRYEDDILKHVFATTVSNISKSEDMDLPSQDHITSSREFSTELGDGETSGTFVAKIKYRLKNDTNAPADIKFDTENISRDAEFLTLIYPDEKPRDDSYDFSMPKQSETVIEANYAGVIGIKFKNPHNVTSPIHRNRNSGSSYHPSNSQHLGSAYQGLPPPSSASIISHAFGYVDSLDYPFGLTETFQNSGYLYQISEESEVDGKTKISRKLLNYYPIPLRVSFDALGTNRKFVEFEADTQITQNTEEFIEVILPPYKPYEGYKVLTKNSEQAEYPSRQEDLDQFKTLEYNLVEP